MRNTSKMTTLENKFPLLAVEQGCIISKDADITVAFEVELPELYTVTGAEYEAIHGCWCKAIKVLPDFSVVHKQDFFIEEDPENLDGLNFLSNQEMSKVNRKVMEATILAHTEGGVPAIVLEVPEINEYELGYMIYFFEKACAISGYLLGVNPFDQPGVESYKKNMFALLGKPGYEDRRADLEARLSK